jgi:outer membrane protein assembly factor BamB
MKTLYAGACLILVSSVLATAPLRADDWQSYQHDPARTGRSTAVINPRKLTVGWKAPVGYSTPLIVGDRIYSTRNGQGIGGSATVITAFELATGAVIWSYSANFTFPSQAAVGGAFVVFQNGSSGGEGAQLYVLDAATGALRYKVPCVAGNLMPLVIAEPSAGSDDAVTAYCAGGSTLQAVQLGAESGLSSMDTNRIIWRIVDADSGRQSIVLAGPGQYYAFDRATAPRTIFTVAASPAAAA